MRILASTPTNVQFEHQLATDFTVYFDFTHSQGVHLTRFININRTGSFAATPLFPTLGDIFVTSAVGKVKLQWVYGGCEKTPQQAYISLKPTTFSPKTRTMTQTNATRSLDRSFNPFNLSLDYSVSDRDIRHKVQLLSFVELGWGIEGNFRIQGRYSATHYTGDWQDCYKSQ